MKSFKKVRLLFLCSLFFFPEFFFSGPIYSQVLMQDSLALVDFFHATKGQNWTDKTNWLSDKPVSLWYGISVNNHRVESISFAYGNNLKDSIPPSFRNLTALKELNLNFNHISFLPREIGGLEALEKLSLSNNQLHSVPPEITDIKALKELDLSGNYLPALPESLGKLVALQMLSVENNKIQELPVSMGNLKSLHTLILAGNLLQGIPAFIGALSSLRVLNAGGNPIEAIPLEITRMDSLGELMLYGCLISLLPSELGNMKSLKKLKLQGNLLSSIPEAIDSLSSLEELELDNNRLSVLPGELGGLKSLKVLSLRNNQLVSIPPSIGQLKNLSELKLQYNRLTSIPAETGSIDSLTHLYLNNNLLSDSIPRELGDLKSLVYLSLNQNSLKGSLPKELGKMGKLKFLFLEVNELDSLPDFSGDTSLTTLTAYNNNLTFEDIEPVLKLHKLSFYYGPQDSVGKFTDTIIHPGEKIKLSVRVGGSQNTYQWFKNGIKITGASAESYTLDSKDSLASGSYSCRVSSGIVKDLTIFSRPVNVVIGALTGVANSIDVPKVFELHQNYPNPFNPSTAIRYDIPREGRVVLKVYSVEGKEVITLIDEVQQAGHRTVTWNGRDSHGNQVSSGLYLYKLQAGGEIKTLKMMLLK